jgi:thioesterase domain-containing protein
MDKLSRLMSGLSSAQKELFLLRLTKLKEETGPGAQNTSLSPIQIWETEGEPFLKELLLRARENTLNPSRTISRITHPSLLEIQPHGYAQPFFCVHAMSGSASCYHDLARHLGKDQPFFGLQAQGLDGQQAPCASIEEMALKYIEAMRVIEREGPYFLGGWSFGGLVAFEMARLLKTRGEKISLLALMDTSVPVRSTNIQMDYADLLMKMVETFTDAELFAVDELRQYEPDAQLIYVWEKLKDSGLVAAGFGFKWFKGYFNVFRANREALANYQPLPYPGRVTLLRAEEQVAPNANDPTLGWGELTEATEVYKVPGNHYTITTEPHVKVLARSLKACLDEANYDLEEDN